MHRQAVRPGNERLHPCIESFKNRAAVPVRFLRKPSVGTDPQTNSSALSIIVLIPAIASIVMLFFWAPAKVFRNIALPTLMLCEAYFFWKIKLLPPVYFTSAVLWPLGVAMLIRMMARWRYSWFDLSILLFVLSSPANDVLHGKTTDAVFDLLYPVALVLVPYMAGKLLIEQDGGRLPFIRRFLMLCCFVAIVGSVEWKWRFNPFANLLDPFFGGGPPDFGTQIRGGHGRASGAFFSGELAGMIWTMALLLGIFLARYYHWGRQRLRFPAWRLSTVFSGVMLVALYLTQSRGPELGLVFGAPIAWVGQTRKVARNALLLVLVMAVSLPVAFKVVSSYAEAGATRAPVSDEQETAAYRIIMVGIYLPSAEHGGFFGQGKDFPKVGKYMSIDNEYLLVWLEQGYLGLGSLLIVSCGTILALIEAIRFRAAEQDRALAYTLLGVFAAMLINVATVYLGLQAEVFFFVIVGWAQTLKVRPAAEPYPSFQQVFT